MTKRLLLVRHGQTTANIDKVWHGSTDTALTVEGEQQRLLLGQNFSLYMAKPDYIVTSPLQRARKTAEAIAAQHELEVAHSTDLQEHCLGEWEGYGFTRLMTELDYFTRMKQDPHYRTPGGESRHDVTTRMVAAIEQAWQQPALNIVVVAHSLAFSFALSHFVTGSSDRWPDFMMDNTAVTELDVATGQIVKFNQTAHLGETFEPSVARYKKQLDLE